MCVRGGEGGRATAGGYGSSTPAPYDARRGAMPPRTLASPPELTVALPFPIHRHSPPPPLLLPLSPELTVGLTDDECAGGCTLSVKNKVGDAASTPFSCAVSN